MGKYKGKAIPMVDGLEDSHQMAYKFVARFNGIFFSCFGAGEVRIMAGPDGKPLLTPFTIKAAMLPRKKTLSEAVNEAGVKDVKVDIVHLTHGSEQRVTWVVSFDGCDLVYTMDKLQADEDVLVWETVLVTPKSMAVDHASSGRMLEDWMNEEEGNF